MNVYAVRQGKEWQEQLCASAQTRAIRLYEPLDFRLEKKKQAEAGSGRVSLRQEVSLFDTITS